MVSVYRSKTKRRIVPDDIKEVSARHVKMRAKRWAELLAAFFHLRLEDAGNDRHATTAPGSSLGQGLEVVQVVASRAHARADFPFGHILMK